MDILKPKYNQPTKKKSTWTQSLVVDFNLAGLKFYSVSCELIPAIMYVSYILTV